jgi:hypothetical protein
MGSAGKLQRGFVRSSVLDLAFLLMLLLLGIGLWQWLSTIVSGDYALSWFMVWLMAAGTAWWWTRSQTLVLRIPAGFLLFLAAGFVLGPLSWWSGSKLVVAAEAAVLAVGAKYLGVPWSGRLQQRLAAGPAPWYLDQSINLIEDLFRWLGICIVTWFAVGVLPLVFVLFLPLAWIPWAALLFGFALTAWYLYKFRKSRVRFLKVPLGLWVFVLTVVVLKLSQKQLMGPMEEGSIELIAYTACWPVVVAGFVEIVVLGTKQK